MQNKDHYHSYIGYALVVSFFLCLISVALIVDMVVFQKCALSDLNVGSTLTGILLLVVVLAFCILEKCNDSGNPFSAVRRWFDSHETIWLARAVTIVYFAYTIAVLLIVLGTGGSQSSPLSSVLLINATFGYSFAKKASVKTAAMLAPIGLYTLALIVHVGTNGLECSVFISGTPLFLITYVAVASLVAIMAKKTAD